MANYIIKWGNLFLYGFSHSGSSLWTMDFDSAVLLTLPRANQLVDNIRLTESIDSEVELAELI